jgi:hypothetical protein
MSTEHPHQVLNHLSDAELLHETARLAERERHATAALIAALIEVDVRRLYLGEGCGSLFAYCAEVLRLSEDAAAARVTAVRMVQRFPPILDLLIDGSLTLTAVTLLRSILTETNCADVLNQARHMSKRQVEHLVAAVKPQPDVPSTIRKLPSKSAHVGERQSALGVVPEPPPIVTTCGPSSNQPPSIPLARPRAVVAPLSSDRYKLQVTLSSEGHDHLRQAQELLRHVVPNGDPAIVVERALALLVQDLERRKYAAVKHSRADSKRRSETRQIPAAVKRAVFARDEGRCAFVGARGRCKERGFLEFHHLIPFADGGATDVANLQLRCRAHNVYEADLWSGELVREEAPSYAATGTQI